MDCVSDSDGSIGLSCLNYVEKEPILPHICGPSNGSAQDGASSSSVMPRFLAMGFSEEMVAEAIKENGDENPEAILDHLLTYSVLQGTQSENEEKTPSDDDNWDDEDYFDMVDFDDIDFEMEMAGQVSIRKKLITLVEMGYGRDEATSAIQRCGEDAPLVELADSICAAQTAENEGRFGEYNASNSAEKHVDKYDPFLHNNKRRRSSSSRWQNSTQMQERLKRAYCQPSISRCHRGGNDGYGERILNLPKPMIGFGLPTYPGRQISRYLPMDAQGPPYFYFENVALTPKGVWDTFTRFMGIAPEFVDSKYFSAACRKRGYIHNLPIANRIQLVPMPPMTILEAFSSARLYWPKWDSRTKFSCLQTRIASARLTESIRAKLDRSPDPPPEAVINEVMRECRKWNLIWVGQNRVAPLEPDEVEFLLGFPKNHTRGVSRIERYNSLGNSFQVDTVAYHLSVLKEMYPNGMRVLSLFSGIGGAEVALHRLGIKMIAVLSVEISKSNRVILRSWWGQTQQEGLLEEMDDVGCVNDVVLKSFIARHGNFDLVIGGSPCNNLAGCNRHHRVGLQGEHSSLFFHYYRILGRVRHLNKKTKD